MRSQRTILPQWDEKGSVGAGRDTCTKEAISTARFCRVMCLPKQVQWQHALDPVDLVKIEEYLHGNILRNDVFFSNEINI